MRFIILTENFYCDFLRWLRNFMLTKNLYCEFLCWLRIYILTKNFYCDFLCWLIIYILTENFYCDFLCWLVIYIFTKKFLFFIAKFFYLKIINFYGPSGILWHNCARQPMYLIVVICTTPERHVVQCIHTNKVRKSCTPHKIIRMKFDRGRIHYTTLYANIQVNLI